MKWILILTLSLVLEDSTFARTRKPTLFDKVAREVQSHLAAPPEDLETCFSPDEACDDKLVKFIQSAKTSLDIAIFDLTHPKIAHEIASAAKRLRVRVIADRRQSKGEHSLVSLLVKANVAVRFGHQRGIMHNKFIVVDDKMVETGSFNYTDSAAKRNNENQIYLAHPAIVARYKSRFEFLWTDAPAISRK